MFMECKEDIIQPNEIKFHTQNNLPFIYVTVNGKGGKFLIDTGASQNFIDINLKDHYNFGLYGDFGDFEGIGGNTKGRYVDNIEIKYNDSILDIDFISIDLYSIRNRIGIAGIIGSKYFNTNKLKIDFENKIIK